MTTSHNVEEIVAHLKANNLTVATAESLTGGLLSATFADVAGASAVLSGGVVAYNDTIKHRLLGVSADTLAARGAVDAETAKQMSVGARMRFQSDIALSTTGVAGPDPSEGKPVGIVFIALATADETTAKLFRFDGDRTHIRHSAVAASLQLVAEWLQQHHR